MTSRPGVSSRTASHLSASGLSSAGSSVRPRNRRLLSENLLDDDDDKIASTHQDGNGLLSTFEASTEARSRKQQGDGRISQFLEDSISQSWLSVQGFASSLLSPGPLSTERTRSVSRYSSRSPNGRQREASQQGRKRAGSGLRTQQTPWGPEPPTKNLGLQDVAAGSLAEREAALKAARTASVLESHDGVNGGLDVTGKHKRRNSDEISGSQVVPEEEDYLVYVHHVGKNDTYAGIILRYKCREDVFRKANGLWSRDSVQTRKWLTIPVDACEVRGRPCDAPSGKNSQGVDLLAPTPDERPSQSHDDFFSQTPSKQGEDGDEKPWEHVRWVSIDSIREPVEIGRISRQAMGYFPPRRKKSIGTLISTPRPSSDLSIAPEGSRPESRRDSSLGSRPNITSSPLSSRSRVNSEAAEYKPAFMRRPGGVGSMGRNVRAPGPEADNFYNWTSKHFPSLNFDDLPTMSVMGSETINYGFKSDGASGLAESSFEQGRDAASHVPSNKHGNGLDKAAAAVETWLRSALAKKPATPLLGARRVGSGGHNPDNDLIELTDAASDDGRALFESADSLTVGSSARTEGDGNVKARLGRKKDD